MEGSKRFVNINKQSNGSNLDGVENSEHILDLLQEIDILKNKFIKF